MFIGSNCGKTGQEENHKEEEEADPRKKSQLVDGAYRIVFNSQNNGSQFHNRINVRDKSLDNFHGDANFDTSDVPPLESVFRTPTI